MMPCLGGAPMPYSDSPEKFIGPRKRVGGERHKSLVSCMIWLPNRGQRPSDRSQRPDRGNRVVGLRTAMLLRNDIVVDGETEAGAFRWRYARNGLRLGLSPASTSTAALFH